MLSLHWSRAWRTRARQHMIMLEAVKLIGNMPRRRSRVDMQAAAAHRRVWWHDGPGLLSVRWPQFVFIEGPQEVRLK